MGNLNIPPLNLKGLFYCPQHKIAHKCFHIPHIKFLSGKLWYLFLSIWPKLNNCPKNPPQHKNGAYLWFTCFSHQTNKNLLVRQISFSKTQQTCDHVLPFAQFLATPVSLICGAILAKSSFVEQFEQNLCADLGCDLGGGVLSCRANVPDTSQW